MTMIRRHFLRLGASVGVAWSLPASPQAQDASAISIVTPYVRATPPAARVGGGYMIIRNSGNAPDRMLSVVSPAAKNVEIHSSTMESGVAKMRHLDKGLEVPAKSDTVLSPGGLHLMFIEPIAPFTVGKPIPVVLVFEKAGTIEATFEVRPFGR